MPIVRARLFLAGSPRGDKAMNPEEAKEELTGLISTLKHLISTHAIKLILFVGLRMLRPLMAFTFTWKWSVKLKTY